METVNREHAASVALKYLLHLIGIAFFYGLLVYTAPGFWMGLLIKKFSKMVLYVPTSEGDKQLFFLLIIYVLFCYVANNFLLKLFEKGKAKQLLISVAVDYFILPLGILSMIVYNNLTIKVPEIEVSSLYNIYVINGLLIVKNVIAYQLVSRKSDTVQKARQKA